VSREDCVSSVSISIGAQLSGRTIFACRLPLETDPAVLDFSGRLRWGLLMKLNVIKNMSMMFIGAGALVLGSSAGADGLSGEITLPLNPFSVGAAINYTYELVPNWFVGGSLKANYTPSFTAAPFSAGARLATNYIINLVETRDLKADAYVGAGVELGFTGGFSATPDVTAGVRATFSISPGVKVYGGLDGKLTVFTTPVFNVIPGVFTYVGGKLEPVTNLEIYAQAGIGYASLFSYDLKLGAYYTVIPEVRLGASVGYGNDAFRASIGAQFAQKPGTLATPGNFLP
jgi:hypothetical protein